MTEHLELNGAERKNGFSYMFGWCLSGFLKKSNDFHEHHYLLFPNGSESIVVCSPHIPNIPQLRTAPGQAMKRGQGFLASHGALEDVGLSSMFGGQVCQIVYVGLIFKI